MTNKVKLSRVQHSLFFIFYSMTIFKPFQLQPLPYDQKALEPYISSETLELHYGKHHRAYLDNLNNLMAIELNMATFGMNDSIINMTRDSYQKHQAIFNNAAQVWNHTFYWESMKQNGGGEPGAEMLELINESYGNYEQFCATFHDIAISQFGSGWVWLVKDTRDKKLSIIKTSNADTPIVKDETMPLITCDVWEHAYYVDYQNLRSKYVKTFLNNLVNWDFAWNNYQKEQN